MIACVAAARRGLIFAACVLSLCIELSWAREHLSAIHVANDDGNITPRPATAQQASDPPDHGSSADTQRDRYGGRGRSRSFPAISRLSWSSQSKVTVALGQVTKGPEPVLTADSPWELRLDNAYTSVFHDPAKNITSLWYNSLINYTTTVGGLHDGTGPQLPCWQPIPCNEVPCTPAAGQKYRGYNCTGSESLAARGIRPRVGEASETGLLYAKSTDGGVTFEKPALGLVGWNGSKANNIVMRHMGGGVITYDETAKVFRMFGRPNDGLDHPTPGQAWWASGMPGISTSIDGISGWSVVDASTRFLNATSPLNYDTMSQLMYSKTRGEWIGISRVPPSPGFRAIGITRSKDMRSWTHAAQVLNGSKCSAAPECRNWSNLSCTDCSTIYNAYSMIAWPWHGGFLAFVGIFHPDCRPVVLKGRPLERVETLLAWSDDSESWQILSNDPTGMNDTPFIPLGAKGSFDSHIIFGGAIPVEVDGTIKVFYSASNGPHNQCGPPEMQALHCRASFIGVATLPVDNWVGLKPNGTNVLGRLVSHNLTLLENETGVDIVADVPDGENSIRVGVVGNSMLSLANSKAIIGASGKISCEWNGDASHIALAWAALRGTTIRLEFELLGNATLFVYNLVASFTGTNAQFQDDDGASAFRITQPARQVNRGSIQSTLLQQKVPIKMDDNFDRSVPPVLFWSSTAGPGETLLIGKSGACPGPCECILTPLGSSGGLPVVLEPAQVNNASIMLTLPSSLPVGAYSVAAGGSTPLIIGRPDLWWVQGDSGNRSTTGGWLRVFGRNIVLGSTKQPNPKDRLDASAVSEAISAAVQRGDFEAVERFASVQATAARQVLERRSNFRTPTLTLTDVATNVALPPIAAHNCSSVDALFMLDASVPPGTYQIGVSNGYMESKLDSFVSPAQPHVETITVVSAASVAFKSTVFAVESYGCKGGVNGTGKIGNESTSGFPVNCTKGVKAAISAAGANGGGTVEFGLGRFYVDSPLLLPHGVLLKGAGMDLTALYFSEDTSESEPGNRTAPHALIAPAKLSCAEHCVGLPDAPRFGLSDLAIYVLSYYQSVIDIRNDTVGVSIRRVRIRANAFHCQDWTSCRGSNCSANGVVPQPPRSVPWEFKGGGSNPLFWIHGQNFIVEDCDLWATWSVFHSSGPTSGDPSAGAPAVSIGGRFGLMRRNTIYNGGSCHWFDNGRELIFEENRCIGNNPMTMGNNIDTYGGGFAHHIYIGSNSIEQVWGNDREVMTYDNAGNAYYGPIASTSSNGTRLTIASAIDPTTYGYTNQIAGGAMVVVSGAGAGQYRRIVSWPRSLPNNSSSTFEIDAPLTAPLDQSSVVEVMPMRGKNIFHNTHYRDGGAFQFYGLGVDNLVVGLTMERGGGFVSWGQYLSGPCRPPDGSGLCGFVNPNLMNEFIGNVVVEGLRAEHQGTPLGMGNWGEKLQLNGHSFAIIDPAPQFIIGHNYGHVVTAADLNRFIVFRGNQVRSNGGFLIGASSDVLVESNTVANTPNASVSGQGHYHVMSGSRAAMFDGNT